MLTARSAAQLSAPQAPDLICHSDLRFLPDLLSAPRPPLCSDTLISASCPVLPALCPGWILLLRFVRRGGLPARSTPLLPTPPPAPARAPCPPCCSRWTRKGGLHRARPGRGRWRRRMRTAPRGLRGQDEIGRGSGCNSGGRARPGESGALTRRELHAGLPLSAPGMAPAAAASAAGRSSPGSVCPGPGRIGAAWGLAQDETQEPKWQHNTLNNFSVKQASC